MRKLEMNELNRLSVDEFKGIEKFPFLIILDNIRSLNNVGSFFRTADAFKAEKLILGGYTPHPPHREIARSALGAEMSVDWEKVENLVNYIDGLRLEGFKVLALEQTEGSINLNQFIPVRGQSYAFVFGNEVEGVSDEVLAVCDGSIEIPQFGTKHSLNVSISAGILMWDFVSKKIT